MASTFFENIDYYRDLISQSTPKSAEVKSTPALANEASDTTICARIRPLSGDESEAHHISGLVNTGLLSTTLFEPRKKFNGSPDVTKSKFTLDRVYGEDVQTASLYQDVANLVSWAWAGGIGTLFAYGQTGSGKTFTVTGITNLLIRDMFAMAEVDNRELHVCCFEILGKKSYNLLDNRRVFSIMEDSFGTVQLVGVQEHRPTSEDAFFALLQASSLLRTSAPTAKNDQSSRSHAIYRIRIVNPSEPSQPCGELYLVDLAGSEGSSDSASHSADRLAETKDINTSLSILKDCIRGRAQWALQPEKPAHIPWRGTKLTQVLKHVFATTGRRACKTIVVACVAPSIVDSAHTKNTLRYAEMLKVPVPKRKEVTDIMTPSTWTNAVLKEWIAKNSGTPQVDAQLLARDLTGVQLCKLPQADFIVRCMGTPGVNKEHAMALYSKLWRLHIDSRQRFTAAKKPASISGSDLSPAASASKASFKSRIQPGMFVRLAPRVSKLPDGDIVMVMSPLSPHDFEKGRGDERKFVCAVVGPSIMAGAYELFVSSTEVKLVADMDKEILMEYDFATRYYYMDL